MQKKVNQASKNSIGSIEIFGPSSFSSMSLIESGVTMLGPSIPGERGRVRHDGMEVGGL